MFPHIWSKVHLNNHIINNHSHLIWMFCSKECNNLINKTHKRALRVVYQDTNSSYEDLLEKDKSCTIHINNLRLLMCEIFKSLHSLNPSFMKDLFALKPLSMNLRAQKILVLPANNSRSRGTNTNLYRAITLWNSLAPSIMNSQSLLELKNKLRSWKGEGCVCKICRQYHFCLYKFCCYYCVYAVIYFIYITVLDFISYCIYNQDLYQL